MIRRQLPAWSPLSAAGIARATRWAAVDPGGSLEALTEVLGSHFAADRVIPTGSGTQALQLAMAAFAGEDVAAGRPVALPAWSCYDLISAAVGARARVVFYDVDPGSLTPDPDGVRRALARGCGALVAGSLFGFPLDWTWLRRECHAAGATLVEDAAQAIGSSWRGADAGTLGDVTVLSFGRGKGWTGGSGGALLLRGPAAAAHPGPLPRAPRARRLRGWVTTLAQWALGRPALYGIPASLPGLSIGETVYKPPVRPHATSAFAAAAVLAHMEPALVEARQRAARAARWTSALAGLPPDAGLRPCRPVEGGACGWLRFPVRAEGGARDALTGQAAARSGVGRGYPLPLPRLPQAAPLLEGPAEEAPGADELAGSLFTLPTHRHVGVADVERLLRELRGRTRGS